MLNFIQPGMDTATAYSGTYDPILLALSLFAAYMGSFSGLSIIKHLHRLENQNKRWVWLAFGSLALGNGIFAMHFIGMLAYKLPVSAQFDLGLTALSGLPALLSAAWMLSIISNQKKGNRLPWIGGAIGGAGIGLMHYTGMMAMHLDAQMLFDPTLFAASIIIAVFLAILASTSQRLCIKLGLDVDSGIGRQIGPIIMGMAISGMHYTAMSATWFFPDGERHGADDLLLDPIIMGIGLVVIFSFYSHQPFLLHI